MGLPLRGERDGGGGGRNGVDARGRPAENGASTGKPPIFVAGNCVAASIWGIAASRDIQTMWRSALPS